MSGKTARSRTPARTGSAPSRAAERKAAIRARSGVETRQRRELAGPAEYPIGKSRKALKGISIYMHPLAKDVLDKIAREQERTVQDLGLEALNLLFRRYGEKPIA